MSKSRSRDGVLTCGSIGDEGAISLASSPGLSRLHHLDLAFCGISSQGLMALSRSLHVKALRRLEIGRVVRRDDMGEKTSKLECYQDYAAPFDVESFVSLARSTHFESLEHLGLQQSDLGAEHIEALANPSGLPRLRSLDLRDNGHGDDLALALAKAPLLSRLEHLDLRYNGISPEGRDALLSSPYVREDAEVRL